MPQTTLALSERNPSATVDDLLAGLQPSFRFAEVSFDSYIPDTNYPSQEHAVEQLRSFAGKTAKNGSSGWLSSLLRTKKNQGPVGVYLDGGFGVGKTHLLASLYHASSGKRAFGTFVEYTNLVGALSFRRTLEVLQDYDLVCIDEFELDDAGDTTMMSRLLRELADAGVKLAATSNTLPGSLGEGRFAASDFQREIQVLSDQFTVLRIDGEDYRHRGLPQAPDPLSDEELLSHAEAQYPQAVTADDDFAALCEHLSAVHPSKYRQLVGDVDVVVLRNVETITAEAVALRFVVLADRLYDQNVKILASGRPFNEVFTEGMLAGGYTKKYYRAVSRLTALARAGQMGEQAL